MTETTESNDIGALRRMMERYAPVQLAPDISHLSNRQRTLLAKLIQASRILNTLCLQQMWSGNLDLLRRLETDRSPEGDLRLQYFWLNKGPWSDLDEHKSFLPALAFPDIPRRKPLGAAYYPEHLTREGFEGWVETLAPEDRRAAEGFFTVIRQNGSSLVSIPYSAVYRDDLEKCGALLREAAALTEEETLRRFLMLRAQALLSNDYFDSDIAWMDLEGVIDITIGPYETYNDELFGYKAGFQSYVALQDFGQTRRLQFFGDHMQEVEDHLPLAPEYRNPKIASQAPIRIVNQIFAAGEGDQGVKAAAFNLPNDERVILQKGSKRVMFRNLQEAKFDAVLRPIAEAVLEPGALRHLQFDSFFTHILAHEMSHGIGPHQIRNGARETTPRQELKDLYSPIEEAKADTLGLFMIQHFNDRGYLSHDEEALYTTFLASSFRTMRFGLNEAHGKSMAVQFNFLMDQGAVVWRSGRWAADVSRFRVAVPELAREILTVEATGDYARAKRLLDKMAVLRPEVSESLARLTAIPVDIHVEFTIADRLAPPES